MISPLSGSISPTRHFIMTVLPLPLVPMMRLHLPVLKTVLTSLMTDFSPNPFLIFLISIIFFFVIGGIALVEHRCDAPFNSSALLDFDPHSQSPLGIGRLRRPPRG